MEQLGLRRMPSEIPNMVLADVATVESWESADDAMKASANYAILKRDQSNASIADKSGIPTGTISGLFSGSGKAMTTHRTRPALMTAMGCMFLAQWEASKFHHVLMHERDQEDLFERLESLEDENTRLKKLLERRGIRDTPSHASRGLSIRGAE